MYENLITRDPYGTQGAKRPWHALEALTPPEPIRTGDPPEQMARCERCPKADCRGDHNCSFRLYGTWTPELPTKVAPQKKAAPPKKRRPSNRKKNPPAGYDQDKLDKAWALEYTHEGLGKRLGISVGRAKRWLDWRREHPC